MPWTAAAPAPSTRRRRRCGGLIYPPAGADARPSSMGLPPSRFFLSPDSSSTARGAGDQAHTFPIGSLLLTASSLPAALLRWAGRGNLEASMGRTNWSWIGGGGDGRETGGRVESRLARPQARRLCRCVAA